MDTFSAPDGHDTWKAENQRGLALARAGEWREADAMFEHALQLLDVSDGALLDAADRDDARAKLLSNRAIVSYKDGRLDDARRFAERSCALRVSLQGEDSLSVARARNDLATILGGLGEPDQALSLLERAVASVERKLGDRSAHLVPLYQNSARILGAAGRVRDAETYLGRLRSLLAALRGSSAMSIAEESESDDILSGAAFDLVDPPPPTLNTLPQKSKFERGTNKLGFDIEYGIPVDQLRSKTEPMLASIPEPGAPPDASANANAAPDGDGTTSDVNSRAMRGIGGPRTGRAQLADAGRVQLLLVILVFFAAGIAAEYFLSPLLQR